ncbi:MAG: glycosyltransferase family 25 protein [Lentisphaeraceae bacterium]|nr:glycosyltransferase family 25 protein [Lentisphaeraceae bacterium]
MKNRIKKSKHYIRLRRIYHSIRRVYWSIGKLKSSKVDKILAVNLKNRPERMRDLKSHLKSCNIPLERIDAVIGAEFDEGYQKELAPNAKVPLSKGAIACFLSHKKGWQQIVDEKLKVTWIIEDDARIKYPLAKHLDSLIEEIETIDPDWEMIYTVKSSVDHFYTVTEFNKVLPHIEKSSRIYDRPFTKNSIRCGPGTCMAGYILSQKGASKLLQLCEEIEYPLDVQIPVTLKQINMYSFSPLISYYLEDGISDSQ